MLLTQRVKAVARVRDEDGTTHRQIGGHVAAPRTQCWYRASSWAPRTSHLKRSAATARSCSWCDRQWASTRSSPCRLSRVASGGRERKYSSAAGSIQV